MNAKKVFVSLLIFVFIFSNAPVFAQMPIAATGVMPSVGELSKIGVVAAIQGKVEVMTPGAAGRVVQSGEEIFIGDEVKTDAMGHLQILLLDETVFTIGPNSAITIDKFIYDPGTHVGKVEASITKGVFRYVSGKIAANKPENVQINLPTATIGIRGTIIAGEVSATGSMAMLLGPGSKNETGATIGSFVMSGTGTNAGQQEHINRTGFGVTVDQAGGVSNVFMVPETKVQYLSGALLPAAGQRMGPAGGENPSGTPPSGAASNQPPAGVRPPNAPVPGAMPGAYTPGSTTGGTTSGPNSATGTYAQGTTTGTGTQSAAMGTYTPGTGTGTYAGSTTGTVTTSMTTTSTFGSSFSAGQTSGASTYQSFQMLGDAATLANTITNLNQDTTVAAQNARTQEGIQNAATNQTVRDTFKQDMFNRTTTSLVTYEHMGGQFNFNNLQGTLDAVVKVSFYQDKVIGTSGTSGNKSYVAVSVPGASLSDYCVLPDRLFTAIPGGDTSPAKFTWTNVPGASGTFTNIEVQFQDIVNPVTSGGTTTSQVDIAAQAKVTVDYTRSVETGTGTVIAPQV